MMWTQNEVKLVAPSHTKHTKERKGEGERGGHFFLLPQISRACKKRGEGATVCLKESGTVYDFLLDSKTRNKGLRFSYGLHILDAL